MRKGPEPAGVKLVVGLGNPGERHRDTRHNAGFWVVEEFARNSGIRSAEDRCGGLFGTGECGSQPVGVFYPLSSMNRSGECVAALIRSLGIEDLARNLVVALDDLDLPLGRLRFRPAGSAGGHRGLESLIEQLGTPDFGRLRFGIGRPPEGQDAVEYVLSPLRPEERDPAREAVTRAARAIETALCEGPETAMDRFNPAESDVFPGSDPDDSRRPSGGGSDREMQ